MIVVYPYKQFWADSFEWHWCAQVKRGGKFCYRRVGYGLTREEALRDFDRKGRRGRRA